MLLRVERAASREHKQRCLGALRHVRAEAVFAQEKREETVQHAEDDEIGAGSCPLPLRHCEEEMDVT